MSLMYRLKNDKKIDNRIFSIYLSDDHDKKSTIKFGGWDQAGITMGQSLEMLKTNRNFNPPKNWDIDIKLVNIGSTKTNSENRLGKIDPYYPMIYVPNNDYAIVQSSLTTAFGSEISCNSNLNYCKFNKACKDVTIKSEADLAMTFFDDVAERIYTLKQKDLLVDGAELGDSSNFCYYGVFGFGSVSYSFSMFLGQPFLKQYYTVFDFTPIDNYGQNYARIGLAPINKVKDDVPGVAYYVPTSQYYDP